ncbi:sugar-binding protein [Curtobacterium sp. 22159]|uniref:sugar-binding protein n=1 Tax=Curtobacterium sp. 22159 TaxID=3453882 RepID=UPI003F853DB8
MKRRTFLSASAATAGLVIAPGLVEGAPALGAVAAASASAPHGAGSATSPDTPVSASNVFVEPEPPRLPVPGAQAGDVVTVTITVPGGDVAWKGTTRIASAKHAEVRVPVGRGYYDVAYSIARGSGTVTASDSFCVLGRIERTVPGLGVNTHFGFTGSAWQPGVLAPLVAAAGIATVRDTQEWGGAEPTKGVYDFTDYRTYRQVLVRNGLTDLPVLSFNNAAYDGGATPYTDAGRAGFAQYAVHLVEQNPHVEYVEVFNEWNSPTFGDRGNGPADCRSDYYFLLLQATVTELRKHYPRLKYVAPATSGVPIDWLKDVFDRGGLDYLDAVSIHPYCYPAAPDQLAQQVSQVQQLIAGYGKQRDVWITELGWTSADTQLSVDARAQASYAVQGATTAYAAGARDFFWYDFMNDGTAPGETEDNFGMVATVADGSTRPKPAYVAYATLARQLAAGRPPGTLTGLLQDSPVPGVSRVALPGAGRSAWVLWAGTPTAVGVGASGRVDHTDTYGATTTLLPADGVVSLTVGPEPVYVSSTRPLTVRSAVRHTLAAHDAKRGDPLGATWTIRNDGRGPARARLVVAGKQVAAVTVPGGATVHEEVAFGPAATVGRRTVHASVVEPRGTVAELLAEYEVTEPVTLSALHVLTDDGDRLRVRLTNASTTAQTITALTWTIGDTTGSVPEVVVAPGASSDQLVDVSALTTKTAYTVSAKSADGSALTATGSIVVVPAADLLHVPRRTITVDGVPELAGTTPTGTLTDANTRVVITGYGGAADLSGDFWLTHDDDRLYLTVAVTDDVHHATATADQIWQNDSVQYAVSAGTPGEASSWDEIGASLVGTDVATWRWSGPAVGPLPDGAVAISRAGTVTTYEAEMSWADLGIDPSGGLVSFSMVVNDNDGAGRKGYIEWASGIGNGKDSALFRGFVLDA